MESLLKVKTVLKIVGIGKTKLYEDITRGIFPAPVKLGICSRWVASEVEAVVKARIKGASKADLVVLVHELEKKRRSA